MSEPRLHVVDDPAREVGAMLAQRALTGETIALTGGSTAAKAYEQAASLEWSRDWSATSVWWSDERCVPPDDERSNYGLAKRTLFDRLEFRPEVHRIRGELPASAASEEYEAALREVSIDLLLLGLGRDGHVASLFPGSPQLLERERLVTNGPAGLEPFVERVTMTLPALLSAQRIVFLITGADKASAVARAFRGEITPDVPGSLLRTGDAPIDIFLDAAAGSALSGR
jgi:6-phosphogluconolactonase